MVVDAQIFLSTCLTECRSAARVMAGPAVLVTVGLPLKAAKIRCSEVRAPEVRRPAGPLSPAVETQRAAREAPASAATRAVALA